MRLHLSDKQKEILVEWVRKQTSLHTEFKASNLPADMYLKLKELHKVILFDEEVEEFIRKQILKDFM